MINQAQLVGQALLGYRRLRDAFLSIFYYQFFLGKTRAQELQDMIWNLEREPKAALLVGLAAAKDP